MADLLTNLMIDPMTELTTSLILCAFYFLPHSMYHVKYITKQKCQNRKGYVGVKVDSIGGP